MWALRKRPCPKLISFILINRVIQGPVYLELGRFHMLSTANVAKANLRTAKAIEALIHIPFG